MAVEVKASGPNLSGGSFTRPGTPPSGWQLEVKKVGSFYRACGFGFYRQKVEGWHFNLPGFGRHLSIPMGAC